MTREERNFKIGQTMERRQAGPTKRQLALDEAYLRGWEDMKKKAIKQVFLSYGSRGNLPLKAIADSIEGWTPEGWTPVNAEPDAPSGTKEGS